MEGVQQPRSQGEPRSGSVWDLTKVLVSQDGYAMGKHLGCSTRERVGLQTPSQGGVPVESWGSGMISFEKVCIWKPVQSSAAGLKGIRLLPRLSFKRKYVNEQTSLSVGFLLP